MLCARLCVQNQKAAFWNPEHDSTQQKIFICKMKWRIEKESCRDVVNQLKNKPGREDNILHSFTSKTESYLPDVIIVALFYSALFLLGYNHDLMKSSMVCEPEL